MAYCRGLTGRATQRAKCSRITSDTLRPSASALRKAASQRSSGMRTLRSVVPLGIVPRRVTFAEVVAEGFTICWPIVVVGPFEKVVSVWSDYADPHFSSFRLSVVAGRTATLRQVQTPLGRDHPSSLPGDLDRLGITPAGVFVNDVARCHAKAAANMLDPVADSDSPVCHTLSVPTPAPTPQGIAA